MLPCVCFFSGFGKEKEKKLDDESSAASHPQSAFLGPTLWDKTLPYDGDNFQLEYMDLEEFLSENGIPANTAQSEQAAQAAQPSQVPLQQAPPPAPPTPSVVDLSSRATTSVHTAMPPQTCLRSPSTASRKHMQPDVHGEAHLLSHTWVLTLSHTFSVRRWWRCMLQSVCSNTENLKGDMFLDQRENERISSCLNLHSCCCCKDFSSVFQLRAGLWSVTG
ncbi:hypothetical protein ILYODFUR_015955 [Ilyodon furcidens]|uniref:Hepatic leukemia factor n=1 Tax=Ilyodon furcidens TaxID=33524 RepID=A0ABV0USP7_9TELE